MKKFTGVAIGALCLIAVVVVCRYVEKQACEKRIQQVREELTTPAPLPTVPPTEMRDVTIEVNAMSRPKIPFIEVPYTPDADALNGHRRLVTFRTDMGTAAITVPVKGKVIFPNSKEIDLPSEDPFVVDDSGVTLEITEANEKDLTIYYQVHCNDGTNQYWAEGESPPRMQIPPV